jgi:hypothetical protein
VMLAFLFREGECVAVDRIAVGACACITER